MEVNGIAHVILTVGNFEACVPFYEQLLKFLGLRTFVKSHNMLYCVGGRTAIGIARCRSDRVGERFDQGRTGLHHLCFRARARHEVDAVYQFLKDIEAKIVHPPMDGEYAAGYYSVLFEDPDGVRLEVNHVPGKGLLAEQP